MAFLPYGRQDITDADVEAVLTVLRSDRITQGPVVGQFEESIANYCSARHAIAVNSATSALHLACLALDVGVGDLVWTSPNTFVATANCARYCDADVGFVDIDPQTYNLCPIALEQRLRMTKAKGEQLPSVVIAVHFAGQSCDMRSINRLAVEFNFRIIEDASHAIGGRYLGEPIGNCKFSDIAVFSFHPVKIITCGEGGIAVTQSPELAERMKRLSSHGVQRGNSAMHGLDNEPWRYQQCELGFNYRLTDIQAALGLSQLKRLDQYVSRRHELASRYDEILLSEHITLPVQAEENYSSMHLYPIQIIGNVQGSFNRLSIYNHMKDDGIGVNVHYIPVHTQPYYQALGHRVGDFPNAESYYSGAISLPLFGVMSDAEQDRVIDSLFSAISHQIAA